MFEVILAIFFLCLIFQGWFEIIEPEVVAPDAPVSHVEVSACHDDSDAFVRKFENPELWMERTVPVTDVLFAWQDYLQIWSLCVVWERFEFASW